MIAGDNKGMCEVCKKRKTFYHVDKNKLCYPNKYTKEVKM